MRQIDNWGMGNMGFRIHYNKLFKNEYLPARTRYSQAFFFVVLVAGLNASRVMKTAFVDESLEMGERKFYSSPRSYVNLPCAWMNASIVGSQVAKQDFTL